MKTGTTSPNRTIKKLEQQHIKLTDRTQLPYTKIEDASRSTAENILLGLAGPTAGLATKTFEGIGKMADGDFIGGLQKAMPTGIANIVKAFDQQEKGLTRANGATILSPAEVGVFDSMMTAVGLKTNTLADKEFINRVETTYEAYYRKETQKVEHDYVQAYKTGDSAAMQNARERWTEINASRRDLGFKTQPMSLYAKSYFKIARALCQPIFCSNFNR